MLTYETSLLEDNTCGCMIYCVQCKKNYIGEPDAIYEIHRVALRIPLFIPANPELNMPWWSRVSDIKTKSTRAGHVLGIHHQGEGHYSLPIKLAVHEVERGTHQSNWLFSVDKNTTVARDGRHGRSDAVAVSSPIARPSGSTIGRRKDAQSGLSAFF